ncbi:MAG: aminopeptidase P family protein [Anaerolineae bacterium]|nr:aminopeptidase P family protein [Anaerolineae bacterium]
MSIQVEEYRRRVDAIRARMAGQALDALLIYSWKRGQVRYVTGYTPNYIANVAAVVLPAAGEPSMFIRFPFDLERARRACWFDDVRASGDVSGVGRDVARALREHGLAAGARVGLAAGDGAMDELPYTLYLQLQADLPGVVWVDARGLVMDARQIKSPAEFDLLRQSARVADAAVEAAQRVMAPGIDPFVVTAAVESVARAQGATAWLPAIAGRASRELIGPPEHEGLPGDDMTIVEFAVEVDGYWTQVARTFAAGRPTGAQRALYRGVYRAYRAEVAACRPGAAFGDIAQAAEAALEAGGFGEHSEHDYGHGIGLDLPEPPRIGADDAATVQPGMVIVLHPAVRAPGVGGAFIGGTVLVHEDHTEEIHRIPVDLPVGKGRDKS